MNYDETDALDFALPIRFTDNDVTYVEQGEDNEIQQRVYAMLAYEPGQFMADPTFGTPSQAFQKGGVDTDMLLASIERMDPTVTETIEGNMDWFMTMAQTITLRRDTSNG